MRDEAFASKRKRCSGSASEWTYHRRSFDAVHQVANDLTGSYG
jgi:hypothetical protein